MENYTISEIKNLLQQDIVEDSILEKLKEDNRIGVQRLVRQYEKRFNESTMNFKNLLQCLSTRMSFVIMVLI